MPPVSEKGAIDHAMHFATFRFASSQVLSVDTSSTRAASFRRQLIQKVCIVQKQQHTRVRMAVNDA